MSNAIDCYMTDMADGAAVFVRVVICDEDGLAKAFSRNGELVGMAKVQSVASYGVIRDNKDVPRYHVSPYVRIACLKHLGKLPVAQVPF